MKATLFAVMTALFVLCNVALAQEYSIRTNGRINLRDAPGLTGDIVETVPSGTILQVVGAYNRWLQINRNGNDVWMADWVAYTRSDQTQTQPLTSQIDNCCFVDRQCNSDEEWTSGYWAFQNNQCNAPLQSRPDTSSQPASTDQSQIDNCCFLDWQCNTDEEWLRGFHAFQNNQCKHQGIIIEGSEAFVSRIEEALDMLKNRSPEWYAFATSGLARIREVPGRTSSGVVANTGTYVMPPSRALGNPNKESSLISLAGGMVHEACHVYHWQAGYVEQSWQNELPCIQRQLEVTEAIDPHDRYSPWLQDIIDNIENPAYWWWTD